MEKIESYPFTEVSTELFFPWRCWEHYEDDVDFILFSGGSLQGMAGVEGKVMMKHIRRHPVF